MSDSGESARTPETAAPQGEVAQTTPAAPAVPESAPRPGAGRVMRKSLPRTTRDNDWAAGSGIEPASAPAEAADDPSSIHTAAGEGIATPGSALPHRAQLEGAFGLDLSSIIGHTGPDAQASARAMGAGGYATGNHVVVPPDASVGLVAHEVTHVLQQEDGVQLAGGVDGGASDPLEQEANAVGAAVERGESVAGRFSAPSSGRKSAHVQRDIMYAPTPAPPPPTEKEKAEQAEAIRRYRIDTATSGIRLASKRWVEAIPTLFAADLSIPLDLPVGRFKQNAYNLAAVDRTDLSPVQAVLEAPGREAHKTAFAEAVQDLDADGPLLGQIKADIDNICQGGQITRNRTRLIAHHAMLRPSGKRAMNEVPSLGTKQLFDYLAGPAREHGKLEDERLGARSATTHAPTAQALENGQGSLYRPLACRHLYDMFKNGAPKVEEPAQAAPSDQAAPQQAGPSPDVQAKVDALRAAIEKALAAVVKSSEGAPVLPYNEQLALDNAIEAAGDEAREIVHADTALMGRLAVALNPAIAKGLLDKLDPIERLYKECASVKAASEPENMELKVKSSTFAGLNEEQIRELIPFKPSSPVYSKIHGWLDTRRGKDKAALRGRLLEHTKLKDDFIDRLPPDESRLVYRLIYRGSEAPTAEDKVHEAAEKKQGATLVEALRELGSSEPDRLKALEKDSVFRASASSMNQQIALRDGQLVRPWHVCMVMWGLDPGDTQGTDPGTAKLSEMNASGNDKPLTIDERLKLEEGLLEPCLREIHDELDGKNDDKEFTERGGEKMRRNVMRKQLHQKGDPQAVSNILCNYDRKATDPLYVSLLQREHIVLGREIERRYQERFGVDLRTWIYENSGPVNRTGANRVLGNEQGASVGMFNGKMLAAGEMDQAGKMTLTQALREFSYNKRPIYEWASVSSRTIAAGLGDMSVVLIEWTMFEMAVKSAAPEITAATGINIRAIDLLRNAYMEHSGHFQTHLEAKYKDRPSELATLKERMGLTANVDVPPDAPPPSPAEQADRMYKSAAAMLWNALSVLQANSEKQWYAIAGTAMNARLLPRVPDDPKAPESKPIEPGQEGYTVEERPPKSFISYYRLMYGATPEHHAAAVVRAMSEPRVVPAAEGATILGIDPRLVTGPWSAPEEKPRVGDHNRHLVRASFTMEVAAKEAEQIWHTLHGSGRMDTIQTILAHYNDEEQALIRAEFRALSGGFDLTFYIRQMMMAREQEKERLEGKSKEISLENAATAFAGTNANALALASNQWGYQVKVGADLTEKGQEAAGVLGAASGGQLRSWSTDSELEQMLSVSTSGNLDVRTRLRAACKRDSQAEIKTIVDELTVPERKLVLQDGPLMNDLYSHLEQYDQERVYKILTGQGDLADRLYSRSHGGSWSERKLWGGTDEAGMRQDIRLYIRQMRLKHNADVRGEVSRMVEGGNRPPSQHDIDKEVTRRVADACVKLASNDSVKAIMKSELDSDEFAEMESMLLNGSGEARDWAVAGGAGKNDILADIRGMSLEQRKERLNDPNYMRLLGARLRDEKDYRDALSALQEGIGGGGSGLSKLDEASRSGAQASGSSSDGQKTLDALVALSQTELEALKRNPTLQVQVMAAMDADQQAVAREYLAGPDSKQKLTIQTADKVQKDEHGNGLWRAGAGGKGGTLADPTLSVDPAQPSKPAVGPDGKPLSAEEAAKLAEAQVAAEKEAYVRFIVHQSIHRVGAQLRTKTSWSLVLEAAVEVYKADLPAVPSKGGDKASPRQIIWNGIAPHMKAFAVYHDAPEHYLEMTLQPITGGQMTEVVEAAVLGQADPTEALIESKISTKAEQDAHERYLRREGASEAEKKLALKLYGMPMPQVPGQEFRTSSKDDVAREDDIKSAVESASDEKVIQNWTTYLERPPGGDKSHTMKARYDEYHTAFEAAKPALQAKVDARKPKKPPPDPSPKSPPPPTSIGPGSDPDAAIDAAAGQAKAEAPAPPTTQLGPLGNEKDPMVAKMELARARFLEFKVTESVLFEAMLRPFMGDDRDLTKDGTFDPNKSKISVSKNKRYNNLIEALMQRATHLRPEAIAALLGMDKNDLWLLQNDMRGEVAQMALSEQKNLRFSGAQRSVGSTASEEKEQLDVTTFMLYKTFADATTDYTITGDEKELLSYRRDQNERARDSYKTALETAAMWASLITSVLVTLAATILTGGLALGPIGMMAIGGVTMLLSAKAQAAVNKQILQDEFDMKDEKDLITKEVTTGLVTMGTTFFAQGLLSTLGKGARLFQQTALMKQVFQKPPSIWGVFLREASEEVISEGMDNVVQAHLEATNPEHFVDGMKIGAKRAHAASSAILSRAPDDMWAAAVTSLITAGVGKLKKGHGKPEFDAPKDARKRTVNLKKNLKMVFGDPEEKFSAAAIEWLVQQGQNGSIDWDNAPEELLKGVLSEYKESVHEVHGQYAHHGMQSRKLEHHLATQGHYLQNSTEVSIFSDINKNAGSTDPFVSAKDFARIRTEVAVAGLKAFEQQNGPLTDAQREAFIRYVREAPETDILHQRAKENPLSISSVKFADANAKPNTAVGRSITDDATAFKLVRDLADGRTDSLKQIGVEVPPGFDPTKNEWGLGRRIDVKTGQASYILIRGEEGAVNWENFPGVEPIAHSHPDKGPDGRQSNHLKKLDADGGVDVVKLCTTDNNDRIHFLPSGADLVFVLAHGIKTHTVLTAFQSLGGGRVGNPTPGSNNAGINIVIKNPKEYGHLFGNPNSPVSEVEIEIWAGSERLHTMKLWGSDHLGGSHLWHEPPADMIMPVDLAAGGEAAGQRPRRTPSGQGHHRDDDPNAPHNRPTQVMPAVQVDENGQVHDQQRAGQESEYDKASKIWKEDQTSAAELKKQIGEEEYEEALGHVKEARLDPDVGPTIAHIPDHELVALYLYTDYHYRRWNLALRENDHTALQEYGARIKAADQALAQLPDHQGWVERGSNYIDPAIMAKYQPGNVVTEQAFTSASAGSGDSGGFVGGDYVFRIKSLTGKQIDKLAKRGDKETEVLFRPGTTFLVTGRTQQDHTTVITMEEVPVDSRQMNAQEHGGQQQRGNDIAPRAADEVDAEAAGKPAREPGQSWLPLYDLRKRLGLLTSGERRFQANEQAIGPGRATSDPNIIATHPNVLVQTAPLDLAQGRDVIRALADGNADALRALGIALPPDFDSKQMEWALALMPDGNYQIIRGDYDHVSGALRFGASELAAHSHPLSKDRQIKQPTPILEVLNNPAIKHLLSPSGASADVGLVRDLQKHGEHIIYLPYQHLGDGVIGQTDSNRPNQGIGQADMAGRPPGLEVHMHERPRIVGTFGTDKDGNPAPVYVVPVDFRAGGQSLHKDDYVVYQQDGVERIELASQVPALLMTAQQEHAGNAQRRGLGGQVGPVDGIEARTGAAHRAMGFEVMDFATAERALKKLAAADKSGLAEIGMIDHRQSHLPEVFWAVGQQVNGSFVLVRGDEHGVVMPPGVTLVVEHAPSLILVRMGPSGMPVSDLEQKNSFSRQSILPALDRFQHFNSGTAVVRYDTGYLFQPPGQGEAQGRIVNPNSQPPGSTLATVSVLLDGATFAGRRHGDPVYRARATVMGSDGTRIWSGDVWVTRHEQFTTEPPSLTPPAEGETWVPVVTGHEPRQSVVPGSNIGPGMARGRGDDGSDDDEGGGRRRRNRDGDDNGGGRERNRDRRRSRDEDQDNDNAERPRIPDGVPLLQTGGHTFDQATADALNARSGRTLERREWGRALERLKKANGLGNDHHGRIWENGDYTDMDGFVIDNLDSYATSEGR